MGFKDKKTGALLAVTLLTLFLCFFLVESVAAQDSTIYGYVHSRRTNDPIAGATVSVYQSGETSPFASMKTDAEGYFEITGLSGGTYDVEVEADSFDSTTSVVRLEEGEVYNLSVSLAPLEKDEEIAAFGASHILSLCFQGMVLVAIVLVISTVMYSKIKRENLLKHAIRKRIYDHIEQNPGKHYRAILNDLDLQIGVLSYHINRLEKAQYIKSRQDGMFRRFYISGRKTDMRFLLSEIQESILNVIKENKGISQTKIAEKIGVSRKVVNYHINILDKAGLILVESRGRESACFPTEYSASVGSPVS